MNPDEQPPNKMTDRARQLSQSMRAALGGRAATDAEENGVNFMEDLLAQFENTAQDAVPLTDTEKVAMADFQSAIAGVSGDLDMETLLQLEISWT